MNTKHIRTAFITLLCAFAIMFIPNSICHAESRSFASDTTTADFDDRADLASAKVYFFVQKPYTYQTFYLECIRNDGEYQDVYSYTLNESHRVFFRSLSFDEANDDYDKYDVYMTSHKSITLPEGDYNFYGELCDVALSHATVYVDANGETLTYNSTSNPTLHLSKDTQNTIYVVMGNMDFNLRFDAKTEINKFHQSRIDDYLAKNGQPMFEKNISKSNPADPEDYYSFYSDYSILEYYGIDSTDINSNNFRKVFSILGSLRNTRGYSFSDDLNALIDFYNDPTVANPELLARLGDNYSQYLYEELLKLYDNNNLSKELDTSSKQYIQEKNPYVEYEAERITSAPVSDRITSAPTATPVAEVTPITKEEFFDVAESVIPTMWETAKGELKEELQKGTTTTDTGFFKRNWLIIVGIILTCVALIAAKILHQKRESEKNNE